MTCSIFLDRDGTLNRLVFYADTGEWESPRTISDFDLLPDAIEVLKTLTMYGWSLILVSNQPSYAKGKTSLGNLEAIDGELRRQLNYHGIVFQARYYCYHHPKAIIPELAISCECRKPGIGSLLKAQQTYDLDLRQCWFIGDQDTDVLCGQNAGCKTIQLTYSPSQSKRGAAIPLYRCASLTEVPGIIGAPPGIIERNR